MDVVQRKRGDRRSVQRDGAHARLKCAPCDTNLAHLTRQFPRRVETAPRVCRKHAMSHERTELADGRV